MKLLKNREIAITLAVMLLFGAAAALGCFFIDRRAGFIVCGLTLAVCAAYLVSVGRRYRRMAELSEKLDRLIAGEEDMDLSGYTEGEFAVLQSELSKLTTLLGKSNSDLKKEKKLLADSIADISHQIRTPLTSVNLLLAALKDPSADEARRRELLSELDRQLERIDRLVSQLLKLARLDADSVSMESRSIELKELIREALLPIEIQMELREQEASVEAEGSLTCDPSWTAEALTNIMKNCSEHMEAGVLYVEAKETPLFSEIVIRDTGTGIDPLDLPHIFERFYRGAGSAPSGVGIGLALSRAIIVRQNGTVKAENAREGGARFTIRFYKSAV